MAYSGPPPSRFAQRRSQSAAPGHHREASRSVCRPGPAEGARRGAGGRDADRVAGRCTPGSRAADPAERRSLYGTPAERACYASSADNDMHMPPAGPERPTRRASEPTGPFAQPPAGAAPTITAAQSPATAGGIRSSAPEPEPYRSSSGEPAYEEPYYDELYGEDDFAGNCMSCAKSAGCSSLWDQYCPPPLNLHIPRGTWANLDYLMWWSRGASLPPLVTTGSQGGALNDPNLKILYGNDRVENTIRSGGRLNIGTWFNPQQTFGIGATFLQLQNMASNYTDVSNGSPIIARPFSTPPRKPPIRSSTRRRAYSPAEFASRDRQLRGRRYVSATGPDPTAGLSPRPGLWLALPAIERFGQHRR